MTIYNLPFPFSLLSLPLLPYIEKINEKTNKQTKTWLFIITLSPPLQVILAVALSWGLCWVLTYLEVLPEDSHARTDLRTNMLYEAPWFRLPYPCECGNRSYRE